MEDENITTLDTSTGNVHEAVALILDAAVTTFSPTDRKELHGVELALGAILSNETSPAAHVLSRAFMRAGVHDQERLDHAVDHAAMAFWNQFAACYPEIGSGDMDAWTNHTLFGAMRSAAEQWLETNA